ncbi:MAG: phosphotransferase [Caldilineales bacterium]|nr:phosphotransferase [Caldilineales bacterium]
MLVWDSAGWRTQAHGWIRTELARLGLEPIGAIEQSHVRPWSTVIRVPTTAGNLYFKACTPGLAHEPGLLSVLSRFRPDCVPRLLAADTARGWALTGDAGVALRGLSTDVQDTLDYWRRILPIYAGLQLEMSAHVDELLATGLPDRRLRSLPEKLDMLLADTAHLLIDQPDGLTAAEYRALHSLSPRLQELCQRLVSYGIPETIDHSDLHDANVFVDGDRITFIDWGDCALTHPFFTMNVTLAVLQYRLGLEENSPELAELQNLYLAAWTDFGSPDRLRKALDLALRLGSLSRALNWHQALADSPPEDWGEDADGVSRWLRRLLTTLSE